MTVMTQTQAGIEDRQQEQLKSAADTLPPTKVQPVRVGSWAKEEGVKYLVALDVDGTLVDHDGKMSRAVKDTARAVVAATVGPVTAQPLEEAGIPALVPERFRMGAMINQLCDVLGPGPQR